MNKSLDGRAFEMSMKEDAVAIRSVGQSLGMCKQCFANNKW